MSKNGTLLLKLMFQAISSPAIIFEFYQVYRGSDWSKNGRFNMKTPWANSDGGWAPKARARSRTIDGNPTWVMWVCMYVCMVFGIISRAKAGSATNDVPKCRSPERALLRHNIIEVRLLTSAARENAKISSAQSKIAREYWQQQKLVQFRRHTQNDKRHCFRLNHAMHAITCSDGGWAPKARSRNRTIDENPILPLGHVCR